ncbi:sigma-54-dependent Fis family transcriptional regulator [Mesorhizobium sp. M4B.F.Ca.ET.215.01.1.1]|uniref:sigma-54-dependent transcriptional regulator n=1 Tax=Mesorhizobium TaxID=68287 RepID=UPI000FCB59A1|nr:MULTISPECIES: sigma-54 dependent transcriptional regulator [Mesorhizobium]MDX8435953.1 sigma-54 dependent transcriptional regulator [Mesorhizobium abyssinicae]RUW20346.1 sigma-54-dependent Fis family transcriptional regulator [Mesorhizobium sp. M4B.F.Ca.ET.013.02.1.1]RVD38565.1 sigma-54-dependent Fis family transcriptional regulator [Mesorhizobium sp. M4B.F.Ca.ET.019.03.1.1]RWX69068.1 response regulator [Mesorhizobium sp. M4B.F.Ca.ET.089.01.1.1]TGQ15076.1 sigma-54-dependent Fis family trans
MATDQPAPVILIDDDADLLKATRQTLELAGFAVSAFSVAREALAGLDAGFAGVVVSDIRMPEIDGLQLFDHIVEVDPDIPVILVTGHGDIAMAVKAIKDGAYDFITKPFAAERLAQSVWRAAEKRRLVMENRALREAAEQAQDSLPLIGQTPAMERLRRTLRQIADTDVDVLVTGETGSGKEVVASLLHRWSRRAQGNFVALNCGTLPETVIESELFGHEAGAFTGAQKKRIGRIEHSSGGTLFLDEIESMPPSTQVQMLRVLEMREVTPLGTNEIRPVDLRVVAAAKVDLGDPAQRGAFREDLYYRLNVVTLSIPPLRERRDDVALLFGYFAERAAARFRRPMPAVPAAVHRHLREHDWPGNVRELTHFAERFVLGLEDAGHAEAPAPAESDAAMALPERLERYEAEIIRETLGRNDGDVRRTIEALGIPRKTFYDKLQRHGIVRSDFSR